MHRRGIVRIIRRVDVKAYDVKHADERGSEKSAHHAVLDAGESDNENVKILVISQSERNRLVLVSEEPYDKGYYNK